MILVFGGNGQVGQSLAREGLVAQIPLRTLSRAEADMMPSRLLPHSHGGVPALSSMPLPLQKSI